MVVLVVAVRLMALQVQPLVLVAQATLRPQVQAKVIMAALE
jgi:hypothetical protein